MLFASTAVFRSPYGLPEPASGARVFASTSKHLRIRTSSQGVHPTVTYAGLWLSPLPAAPASAWPRPQVLLRALQLGVKDPLTAVLDVGLLEKMHFLYFSKGKKVSLCMSGDVKT